MLIASFFWVLSALLVLIDFASIYQFGANSLNMVVLVLAAVVVILTKMSRSPSLRSLLLMLVLVPVILVSWDAAIGLDVSEHTQSIVVMCLLAVGMLHCTDLARRLSEGDA